MRPYLLACILGFSLSLGWAHDGGIDHYLYRTTLCLSPQSVQIMFNSGGRYADALLSAAMRERLYSYARNTFRASAVPLEERPDCVGADGFLLLLLRAEATGDGVYTYAVSAQVGRYTAQDGFNFRTRLPVYRYENTLSLPYNEADTGEAVYSYLPGMLERMMRDITLAYWVDNAPQEGPVSRPPVRLLTALMLGVVLAFLGWRYIAPAKPLPRQQLRRQNLRN